jgi:hypothetical protein
LSPLPAVDGGLRRQDAFGISSASLQATLLQGSTNVMAGLELPK